VHHLKSNRVAWSIATASLALLVWSTPHSWAAVGTGTARLLAETDSPPDAGTLDVPVEEPAVTIDNNGQGTTCQTLPTAIARLLSAPPMPAPSLPAPPATAGGNEGTFHICGSDPAAESAIEQLVAGRGLSASIAARGDGCADLVVRVDSNLVEGSSSSTINLSVSLGSGRVLDIQIASGQGTTHASIVAR
jgi:hypothetical protein